MNSEAKIKADTYVEVMNIINRAYSLSEAKKRLNQLAIKAVQDLHKAK